MARKPRSSGSRSTKPAPPSAGVLSASNLSDAAVEHLLATGDKAGLLEELFGEAEYRELRTLAREARSVRSPPDHLVLLLPGIMGSKQHRSVEFPVPPLFIPGEKRFHFFVGSNFCKLNLLPTKKRFHFFVGSKFSLQKLL